MLKRSSVASVAKTSELLPWHVEAVRFLTLNTCGERVDKNPCWKSSQTFKPEMTSSPSKALSVSSTTWLHCPSVLPHHHLVQPDPVAWVMQLVIPRETREQRSRSVCQQLKKWVWGPQTHSNLAEHKVTSGSWTQKAPGWKLFPFPRPCVYWKD